MLRLLLRFDDLCPTMNWDVWDRIEALLDESGVQPILAVVPANEDPRLVVDRENPKFWDRARAWQAKGWVIGQHGYRHVYDSKDPGLVPWWRQSEFAGHPYEVQHARLEQGLKALRREGLNPSTWVAPSHTFDAVTVRALHQLGLRVISDGVGFRPYVDDVGMVWIPMQPWRPWPVRSGTWTLCFHHNPLQSVEPLRRLVSDERERLMGVGFRFDDLLAAARPKTAADAAFERAYWPLFVGRRNLRNALKPRRKPARDDADRS
jgi:predicted deacetylase